MVEGLCVCVCVWCRDVPGSAGARAAARAARPATARPPRSPPAAPRPACTTTRSPLHNTVKRYITL